MNGSQNGIISNQHLKANLKARQGVKYLDGILDVCDPKKMKPVKKDGKSLGEVFLRAIS